MMLYQVHYQYIENGKSVKTVMCSQAEINTRNELEKLVNETKESLPLPKGAIWMVCTEQSEYFVRTYLEK